MALASNPFTNRDYQNWQADQFAMGRAISAQAHDRNMELSSMVENMRGNNAARVAQINADVGMANIEAHKPLLGAQASAINEMIPIKKKLGEQEIETGDINNKLGKLQLGFEPEFLQKKLDFANLGAAGYKTNILSAMEGALKGYKGLKEGGGPSYLNDLFGINAPEIKGANGEAGEGATDVAKPKTWRNNSIIRAGSYLIPMATGMLGGIAGGIAPIPGGTFMGAAGGSAVGEYLRQKLMGEETDPGSIMFSGLGGGMAGKWGNKAASWAAGKYMPKQFKIPGGKTPHDINFGTKNLSPTNRKYNPNELQELANQLDVSNFGR